MLDRKEIFALAVLASTAWTSVTLAKEFHKHIRMSSLDGNNGFQLDGAAAGDESGRSVASAGDVNGDGFADIIIGAPHADPSGDLSGSSYVVFGKSSGFPARINLSTLDGSNGFRLSGESAYGQSGYTVASAGDVNGDGFADVIVEAPRAQHVNHSGSSYVVFGKASGFAASIDLSVLNGKNGFRLDGAIYDYSGRSIASAGDVNGDGFDDIIIGAPGARPHGSSSGSTYVVFGKASGFRASIDLSTLDGNDGFRLDGEAWNDNSGESVASAGDVNGDGFADVIIGAECANQCAGSSYVVFGKAAGFAAAIDLSTLDGTNGFRLDGVAANQFSGFSVATAGDVNGDGFADVMVGNRRGGLTYVVFGKASGFASTINLSTIDGVNGFGISLSGFVVASAGDVNGDGFADLIVGAYRGDSHCYVLFGKASGFPASIDVSTLTGRNGFSLDGVAPSAWKGYSVASAGDVNGDGFDDMIVGAIYADAPQFAGSSYVIFGRAPDSERNRIGAEADQYISGGAFDDTLRGRGGNDALEGRGGADTLIGGLGNDSASYFHSGGGVNASLANPDSNLGEAAGDSYSTIEDLIGSRFDDELIGNSLPNSLTGAQGSDALSGEGGANLFVYYAVSDSPAGVGRDKITDFDAGSTATSVDKIDLRPIDARTGPHNQAFTWIGTAAFSSTKGQLRVKRSGTSAIIQGDVNGDGAADVEIELLNFADLATVTAIDFRL